MYQLSNLLVEFGISRMFRRYFPLLLMFSSVAMSSGVSGAAPAATESNQRHECVVLLHGLARSHRSMTPLEESLAAEGYHVINSEYNSLEAPIETLAPRAIDSAIDQCPPKSNTIHFVTHSLGGILVRQYLQQQPTTPIGRVVMLGPPNQGSELVDRFVTVPGFNKLNGFAGKQLGTGDNSKPNTLNKANFELGIIAGSKSINPILSLVLPGDDDGKVSVESTKLNGMKAHITLPTTHTFMMRNSVVIAQVSHFLKHGKFDTDTQ